MENTIVSADNLLDKVRQKQQEIDSRKLRKSIFH